MCVPTLQEVRYQYRLLCPLRVNADVVDLPMLVNMVTTLQAMLSSYVDAVVELDRPRGSKAPAAAPTPPATAWKQRPLKFKAVKECARSLCCCAAVC